LFICERPFKSVWHEYVSVNKQTFNQKE